MDFTIKKYQELLVSLKSAGYEFQTFKDFVENPKEKCIVLRHDVDLLPKNSLRFAKFQNSLNIKGTYYFRAVKESWDESIIKEIDSLNHEIGYHYENLTTCKGDFKSGIQDFKNNLKALRELVPVSTICMHGSPISKYDSKDLWKNFNYKDYGIIGEPYFDLDFDKIFYLTDTGRRWDGDKVSVRDKVDSTFQENYHSTNQIINALRNSELPDQIMFTFHPQRWNNNFLKWTRELLFQNAKNIVKKKFIVRRNIQSIQ